MGRLKDEKVRREAQNGCANGLNFSTVSKLQEFYHAGYKTLGGLLVAVSLTEVIKRRADRHYEVMGL